MVKCSLLAHFLFFFSGAFCAQDSLNGRSVKAFWQIKPAVHKGFILVHRISIGHLVKGYPTIYELNIAKATSGEKLWQLENNKPDLGFTFQFTDFSNPGQLGYAYTAAPYAEIPLNVAEKHSRLVMRLCWGISYLTSPFDIESNHKNIAIGSHWNCFAQFKWFWRIPLGAHLRVEPGFGFSHYSNGRSVNPNLGLNIASLNLAVNYRLPSGKSHSISRIDSSTRVRSKNELLFFAAAGFNQRNIHSPEIPTFVVSAAFQRNKRNTHKFSAGIDLYYDRNYIMDFENAMSRPPSGLESIRLSIRGGYSYNLGRVSFPLEVGYYVYQAINPDANIVSRVGVRYYSKPGLVFHFGLRTHFAVAYNFEYGVGYRIFLK
jgi:hypothetical protein